MTLSSQEKNRLRANYGPWAVVTGASSGIGRELSQTLAEAGFSLLLASRRREVLEAFAQELRHKQGGSVEVVACDLAEASGVQQLIQASQAHDIGLLVASAGYGSSGYFLESALSSEVNQLRVNCEALLRLTHHFAGRFAQQQRGGIILMSSMVAFQGVPFSANYAATKAYVQSLSEALSVELQEKGVAVLAAAPGPVASGFAQRANMSMGMALRPNQVAVPILRALGRKHTVLPGFLTKFLVYSLRLLPRWGKVRAMKLVMSGMTAHQR